MNTNKNTLIFILIIMTVFIYSGTTIANEVINPFYHRIINGKPNKNVVILERLVEKELPYFSSKLVIPVLYSITENESLFHQLNDMFFEGITYFAQEVEALAESHLDELKEVMGYFPKYDVVVTFDVPYNSGGLLSIRVHFYQYTGGAHGLSFVETVNLDLTTGRSLEFKDLFDTSRIKAALVDSIQADIDKDPFNYFIKEVDSNILTKIQSFYLKKGKIVVYFDLYEIAPYSTGIPEFSLDLTKLTK